MIHGEPMVLEQASRQRHLVSSLNQASTEVSHALLLVLSHHVEGGGEELLAKTLCCCKVLHLVVLGRTIRVVNHGLADWSSALGFHSNQKQMVRRLLSLNLGLIDEIHVSAEEETTNG